MQTSLAVHSIDTRNTVDYPQTLQAFRKVNVLLASKYSTVCHSIPCKFTTLKDIRLSFNQLAENT